MAPERKAMMVATILGVNQMGIQTACVADAVETQITRGPGGRILANIGTWSPDGQWIIYDTRGDAAGDVFDATRIEMVNTRTREARVLYESRNGARCGVPTFHPRELRAAFILGPENPSPDWHYGPTHRRGVIADAARPGVAENLDARDIVPPFTPGALRGGSHVHVWDAAGEWVSFTYEDHVLARFTDASPDHDINLRNVGVAIPDRPVRVPKTHPRNHDGQFFSVLVTRTTGNPRPGSDEIRRAFEEGWIGTNGYLRAVGTRQRRALAFQGHVVAPTGATIAEVFVADLPDDLTRPGDGPLQGTDTRMPYAPRGVTQRRITFTTDRKHPGIQGPRHWLRSSPDGSRIAFLMKDDSGIAQLWTISPNGGTPSQLTQNPWPIASSFTWSPDGRLIAHAMDNSVCLTDTTTGTTTRLTPRSDDARAPRPEACVFSPDGSRIAFVRRIPSPDTPANQIFTVKIK